MNEDDYMFRDIFDKIVLTILGGLLGALICANILFKDDNKKSMDTFCIKETNTVYVSSAQGGLAILVTESGDIATCDILKK